MKQSREKKVSVNCKLTKSQVVIQNAEEWGGGKKNFIYRRMVNVSRTEEKYKLIL